MSARASSGRLGLGTRAAALDRLATTQLDLLVVGGGITGAGIALDAASRGLSVGLVEKLDFASGTSSKSSKLVHGGLRYLEQREFSLVREASSERILLGRLAPQLVEPIPFVIPVSDRWRRAMFGVGLWAYDALASFRNMSMHRHIGTDEVEKMLPVLPKGTARGGYVFYDSKTDDVRLVMEALVQARRHGAIAVNYAAVRGLDASEKGCAALVEDTLTGDVLEVPSRRVVLAAGVWTDGLEMLVSPESVPRTRPSKGVHLVFRKDDFPIGDAAAFIPDADKERMLFVVPWLDCTLVGTTDTAYEGPLDHPTVAAHDLAYCLDAVNAAFRVDLTAAHVAGAYAGLRPLLMGRAGATADLSRRHAVYEVAPGVLGITGGKLTTFRRMAEDAVDRVADDLDLTRPSRTRLIRLGASDVDALRVAVDRRARWIGISQAATANLVRSYGDRSLHVLDMAVELGLEGPLAEGALPLAAEAVYCARAEMAVQLEDLLARRTRLALVERAAGIGSGGKAAELMSAELAWSRLETRRQIDSYRAEVQRERGLPVERPAPRLAGSGAGAGAG